MYSIIIFKYYYYEFTMFLSMKKLAYFMYSVCFLPEVLRSKE